MQKIILLGYGSIGKCVLDLLLLDTDYITRKTGIVIKNIDIIVIDRLLKLDSVASSYANVRWMQKKLSKKTIVATLQEVSLGAGDLVIDLTSCTGSRLIAKTVAVNFGAMYISTALEGWNGWMLPMHKMVSELTQLKTSLPHGSPTLLVTHGMNPGMVSHYALIALEMLDTHDRKAVKCIHITETDTQRLKRGVKLSSATHVAVPRLTVTRSCMSKKILSTWGPQNFVDEMNARPLYVEKGRVKEGHRRAFRDCVESFIFNPEQGHMTTYRGHSVTHEECFTINNYLRKALGVRADIAFIYKPSDLSLASFLKQGHPMKPGERKGLLLRGPGVIGYDTVGIYVETHTGKKVWIGNSCKAGYAANEAIRRRYHNATTIQVAAGVLAAIYVASKAPRLGLCFPEEIPGKLRRELVGMSERYYGPVTVWQG